MQEVFNLHVGIFQVKSPRTYFNWLDTYFLPSYYPVNDYNNVRLHWTLRQFTQDRSSFRVGPALLRQLRSERG